jgi:MoaA/NifB/PqqE/SkfB family radical SAM enzyme
MNSFFKNLKHSYEVFSKGKNGKEVNTIRNEPPGVLSKIRIYLTENCNANCSHCFNAKIREDKHMDTLTVKNMFDYLNKNKVKALKIMGGEPTIHPDFIDIYNHSQARFEHVGLFTNALNENIFNIKPRPIDSIVYNYVFINNKFDYQKLLPDIPSFFRVFEIVVDSKTNLKSLFDRIEYTYTKCKEFNIDDEHIMLQLTLNCVENIFDSKETINYNFLETIKFIKKIAPNSLSFDHQYPYCFWLPETIEQMDQMNVNVYKGTCTGYDVGLIDSDFNLLHCNQHPVNLLNILNPSGGFIDFTLIKNTLLKSNLEKQIINIDKGCKYCEHFKEKCTGSCFMHKDFIPGYKPKIANVPETV